MTWQKEKSGKTRQELVKEAVVKTPLAAENRAFSKTDVNDPQEKKVLTVNVSRRRSVRCRS